MELIMRRRQLLADAHADKPLNPKWEDSEHYLGMGERARGAVIAPSLRSHIAAELSKQTATAKERRKAREVKSSPRGKKNKKGEKAPDE